jgi:hypothetical protein
MAARENDRVAIIYDDSIILRNTTDANNSSTGALQVIGGISVQKAAYIGDNVSVQGNVSINNVDITPNLNDIILEQQATLLPDQNEFINVANFYFDNNLTSAFRAHVNVHVTGTATKFALWEINGILQNDTWVIASTFTGELTGVQFRIIDDQGFGRIQYTNSNGEGSMTYVRFTAKTKQPHGTNTQFGDSVIQNNSMNFIENGLLFASSADTIASSTDFMIKTGVVEVGPIRSLKIVNTAESTGVGTGGSLTILGGASVSKNLYIGGDISANGTLYSNGTAVFSDRRIKQNIEDVSPESSLDRVLSLRVKMYNYTDNFLQGTKQEAGDKIGFIAQEVKEVIPYAVENRQLQLPDLELNDFHYLNHDAIFTEAIGAIQELHRQLQEAKKEIEELKKR